MNCVLTVIYELGLYEVLSITLLLPFQFTFNKILPNETQTVKIIISHPATGVNDMSFNKIKIPQAANDKRQ